VLTTQKQAIESYRRVQEFLASHPLPESPGYLAQKKVLDEVVATLDDHSVQQSVGRRLTRAEAARQRALRKKLREEHLVPIARIARETLADAPGIEKAVALPSHSVGTTRLVAEADAMRTTTALYDQQFIAAARPTDFLDQLDGIVAEIKRSASGQALGLGRQVGASAGIELEIKRGRRAVNLIDTIVRTAFRGDQALLAKWRIARRVRGVANGGGIRNEVAQDTTPSTPPPAMPSAA
jgi:hypothetical protein